MADTIGLIVGLLVVTCTVLSAHYLAQIRDILKDIRDNKTSKPQRSHYGYSA